MSVIRSLVQVSLVAACAAVSFVSAHAYMSAKAETAPLVISSSPPVVSIVKADPIAAKLAEDSDLTGAKLRPMSPIYPTRKYTQAQLAAPAVKKPAKAAIRVLNKMPIQLAYAPEARIADRAAPIFSRIR